MKGLVTMGFESESSYYNDLIDARTRIEMLENCIRELLKSGEHEGLCGNDQGMLNEGGACMKHIEASFIREEAARKILEEV